MKSPAQIKSEYCFLNVGQDIEHIVQIQKTAVSVEHEIWSLLHLANELYAFTLANN